LSDVVERVVRGTWLWPSEKRDVRAELESHFREGLFELTQEGKSLDESVARLRDEFGDPALAARLIRRGKKRGRPMYWKILVSTLVVSVVVLGAGAGYVTYISFGQPTPTVDYIAKINEPVEAIPHEQRAWPLLREIALELQPGLEQIGQRGLPLPMPGEAGWVELMGHVLAARSMLPRIAGAVNKPSFGFVYGKDGTDYLRQRAAVVPRRDEAEASAVDDAVDPLVPPTLMMLLPHLTDLRAMGKFLTLDARERMTRGEFTDAWQSLDVAFGLGSHCLAGHTLIEQLVGVAIIKLATDEMRASLFQMRDRLTPEQLQTVRSGRLFTAPADAIRPNLKGEQFFFEDAVQYTFTDDGTGNGRLIPSQFGKITAYAMPTSQPSAQGQDITSDAYLLGLAAVHADRRSTLSKYHELLDRAVEFWSLPLYDPRRADGNELIEQLQKHPTDSTRFALIGALLPALSRADQMIREAALSRLGTQTVIALLTYKAEHGAFPSRLAELTPRYLPQLPTDAYSGMLLRFSQASAGDIRVYSVGRNLKDDGGTAEKAADPARADVMIEADLVFWPPK
jgi:hypothetical protein